MNIEEQRRKAFEAWWQIMRPQTSRAWAWNCWNAALDSAEIDLSTLRISSRPGFIGSERVYVSDVTELCEAAGLKVKP